jgi:glycosyltransferase involved in cell wall biosynthesis
MADSKGTLLTVVLAAKDPKAAQFDACVASIAALRNSSRIDLVIVVSGEVPALSAPVTERLHRVLIVTQPPRGVYPAYNRGLDEACSQYVMVMGCDDLLLPGLDNVIDSLGGKPRPHIVAACTLMQDIGLTRPSRFRWSFVFRNWCQQGLLYRADLFTARRFDCKYPMQADHKFNMELVSGAGTVVEYRHDVICHCSSGGLSQRAPDWAFREDMPEIVRRCYGPFFWVLALLRRGLGDRFRRRSWQPTAEGEARFEEKVCLHPGDGTPARPGAAPGAERATQEPAASERSDGLALERR